MKILKNIVVILLSFVVIITLYTLFILSNVSSFFSTPNIQKATTNIDTVHEMEKIQNSTATAGKKAEIADIINTAYNEAESHGIPKNLVDEIFNSKEVKEFFGKVVGNTTDYIVNGTKPTTLTSEDFNKLLDNNIDKWIKESKTKISDSKKEVLVIRIKNASRGIIDNLPTSQTIEKNINETTLNQIRFIFSKEVKVSLVIIIIFSLSLLTLLKRKEKKYLVYYGLIPLITGLLTLATSFVINDLVSMSLNNYNISFMTNSFSTIFSHQILITGLASIIISIIIFIIYGILYKKQIETK